MKIKYVVEDDLNTIKSNLNTIYEKVFKSNNAVSNVLSNENIIRDTSFQINEFELDMSQPKGKESLTDCENIQRIYNNMMHLTDSQASDERIWVAYTFSECIDYMKYRWPVNSVSDLENHYLFGYSSQRSLFRNGIARLWWIGRFSYDSKRSDPYELTKFLCSDQDYIESLCGRNIFNNPLIGNATLAVLNDAKKQGKLINREVVRDIAKKVNLMCGTYLVDIFEYDEIYDKIRKLIN